MTVITGQVVDPNAQVGHCLIGVGNNTWRLYSAQNNAALNFYAGCPVGVLLQIPSANGSAQIQTAGAIDPAVFTLGAGAATTVYASTFPIRASSGVSPIGTVDAFGAITLASNVVGTTGASSGGGGGGGGATVVTTTANYTQPAVAATVVVAVSSATAAVVGAGCTVAGGGFYVVSGISGLNVTLTNVAIANNAVPTTVIGTGAIVTFNAVTTDPHYFADLSTFLPQKARQTLSLDGYRAAGDGGSGSFVWKTVLDGTYAVSAITNGTPNFTFTVAQSLLAGTPLVFASDPTHTYFLSAKIVAATAGVLTTNFLGGTGATTVQYGRPDDGGTKATPAGYTGLGWWDRDISQSPDQYNILHFGANGGGGVDNLALIQGVADLCTYAGNRKKLYIPAGPNVQHMLDNTWITNYAMSGPLVLNDSFSNGNACAEILGQGETMVGLCATTFVNDPQYPPTWLGPMIVMGDGTQVAVYSSDPYGAHAMQAITMGDSTRRATLSPFFLNFSQFYGGDLSLSGTGNSWEIETFYNPGATAPSVTPGDDTYAIASIYGTYAPGTTYTSMTLTRHNVAASIFVTCSVTTQNGTYTVSSLTSGPAGAPLDLTLNQQNAIALTFDDVNHNLTLRINGTTGVGGGMTVAMTAGSKILMKWYSEFVLGAGPFGGWPEQFGPLFKTGPTIKVGKTHITKGITRHTSNYSPDPAAMVADSNTACLLDFASAAPRKSMGDWRIAYTGMDHHGSAISPPIPVYFDCSATGVAYTSNGRISGLTLCNEGGGVGIVTVAAQNTIIENLKLIGFHRGIEFLHYSYGSSITKNVVFRVLNYGQTLGVPCCFHSWGILLGDGAQFMTVGPNIGNVGGGGTANWHLVSTFINFEMDAAYMGDTNVGSIACVGQTTAAILNNVTIDDENTQQTLCSILAVGNMSLEINGGYSSSLAVTSVPTLKVGNGAMVTTGMTAFRSPMVSFFSDQNLGIPVVFTTPPGTYLGAVVYVDAANPGPVLVAAQELWTHPITMPDASTVLPANDQLWGYENITGTLTATRTLTNVNFNIGKLTWVHNGTGQTINRGGPSGAAVAIAAGTTVRVRDTGTALVIA